MRRTRKAKQVVRKGNPKLLRKMIRITVMTRTEKRQGNLLKRIQKLPRFKIKSLTTFMSVHVVDKPLIAIA